MLVLCGVIYFALVALIGKVTSGGGDGSTVVANSNVAGYERIGQKFTDDKYFWGRPSAVDYNAAGSAGSNKGPSNPDYLKIVWDRIDSFLVHNPGIKKEEIPADLVTASGSGLDPDISPASAYVQVRRIAVIRNLEEEKVKALVEQHIDRPFIGLAPEKVNVLKLNIALDKMSGQ